MKKKVKCNFCPTAQVNGVVLAGPRHTEPDFCLYLGQPPRDYDMVFYETSPANLLHCKQQGILPFFTFAKVAQLGIKCIWSSPPT